MKNTLYFSVIFMMSMLVADARGVYLQPADFLADVFQGKVPAVKYLWLSGSKKAVIKNILGHDYGKLRLKYWQQGKRIAWILEEIGKEEPITIGIVIKKDQIEQLKVLIYRESRGEEVRHAFFTLQFKGVKLDKNKNLSQHIDGITGATLSVGALKRLSRLALWLSKTVLSENPANPQSPSVK